MLHILTTPCQTKLNIYLHAALFPKQDVKQSMIKDLQNRSEHRNGAQKREPQLPNTTADTIRKNQY